VSGRPAFRPIGLQQEDLNRVWLEAGRRARVMDPRKSRFPTKPRLAVYEISDVNPSRVHITVPKSARLRRRKPKWIVIHRGDLPLADVTLHEGLPVTTVAKSVLDGWAKPGGWDWPAKPSKIGARKDTLTRRKRTGSRAN
jgi:hypothetical protein